MSIFSNLFTKTIVGDTNTELKKQDDYLNFPNTPFNLDYAENISTVYTSCKILAEDIGSLPLNIYRNEEDNSKTLEKKDYRYSLLHYNPNNYTTSNTFFTTLEYIRNIKGNAFARIYKDGNGFITSFSVVAPWKIFAYKIVDNELYYSYRDNINDKNGTLINSNEFLHFRTLSDDGIWGTNPIEKLRLNLSTTYKAFHTIDKFYDNNATSPKALKTSIPEGINPKEWQEKIADFTAKYGGFKNAGKVISLPPFTELQDITLNFADAEFIATIRFNADQIASLYKIPPHLVGNFESSKFNNLEQLQLNYKINTLRPILRMYRQELEHKLLTTEERIAGKSIEFNAMAVTETDSKTRIENYKQLFSIGALTPNDVLKYEGGKAYEGGNEHYLMTNLMSVEKYNNKKDVNI